MMNSVVHKSCSAASIPESSRLPGHWVDSGSVLLYLPFRAVQGEDSHSGRRRCELRGLWERSVGGTWKRAQESRCQCLRSHG